ncbi:hypothetical protein I350_03900 [Cryptococcus amylolentus CBS 6273]|uniref:Uncharacterized protein n=1 Tax=Cryptococcus amylolentus CBS 6273 TaxID=1296118 RepID=A0A1E3K0G5_9TREE|nr:hypothetical protein I350_03900 [Cryptococcus amylolentus CBS 6273]
MRSGSIRVIAPSPTRYSLDTAQFVTPFSSSFIQSITQPSHPAYLHTLHTAPFTLSPPSGSPSPLPPASPPSSAPPFSAPPSSAPPSSAPTFSAPGVGWALPLFPKHRFNKGREVVGVLLDLLLLGGLIAWWVGMRASPEKRPGGLAVLPYVLMRWRWCTTPFAAAPADAARTDAGPPPTALVAALATALASRAIDDGLPAPATAQLPPEVQAQLDRMKPCSWPLPLSHPSFAGVVFGSVIYWHKST